MLEVVVALAVAALACTMALRAAGTGLRSTMDAALYNQAVVLAKSHLAAATNGMRLQSGTSQGDDGRFHWSLRVVAEQNGLIHQTRLLSPQIAQSMPSIHVVLYGVTVLVSWKTNNTARQVSLYTEQIGGS